MFFNKTFGIKNTENKEDFMGLFDDCSKKR